MTQVEHNITIDELHKHGVIRYQPVCSCGRYSAAWGWSRPNAESRGRAHVERAAAADARRAAIIAGASGAPIIGKGRPGGVAGKRAHRG